MQIGDGDKVDVSADGHTVTFQASADREGGLSLPRLGAERQTSRLPTVSIKAQVDRAMPTLLQGPLSAAGLAGAVVLAIVVKRLRSTAASARILRSNAGGATSAAAGNEAENRAAFEARYGSGCK